METGLLPLLPGGGQQEVMLCTYVHAYVCLYVGTYVHTYYFHTNCDKHPHVLLGHSLE